MFLKMATSGGALVLAVVLVGAVAAQADDLPNPTHPDLALHQKLDLLDHGTDTPNTPPGPVVNEGSFPHSIRIPGTDTSIRIHGSVSETLQYGR